MYLFCERVGREQETGAIVHGRGQARVQSQSTSTQAHNTQYIKGGNTRSGGLSDFAVVVVFLVLIVYVFLIVVAVMVVVFLVLIVYVLLIAVAVMVVGFVLIVLAAVAGDGGHGSDTRPKKKKCGISRIAFVALQRQMEFCPSL